MESVRCSPLGVHQRDRAILAGRLSTTRGHSLGPRKGTSSTFGGQPTWPCSRPAPSGRRLMAKDVRQSRALDGPRRSRQQNPSQDAAGEASRGLERPPRGDGQHPSREHPARDARAGGWRSATTTLEPSRRTTTTEARRIRRCTLQGCLTLIRPPDVKRERAGARSPSSDLVWKVAKDNDGGEGVGPQL